MKTTLDLPEDVALTLRMESARRGGRRAASYSKLVADAVRKVYAGEQTAPCQIDLEEGRVVVAPPSENPIVRSDDVRSALDEM